MTPNLGPLIEKLMGWNLDSGDFHTDRQLSDEVLVADGWRVQEDKAFEGGIRWSFGKCPEVSVADANRPHVINDLNAAVGVVPIGCSWQLQVSPTGETAARVWLETTAGTMWAEGASPRSSVALLIAALKFKETHRRNSRN